MRLPGKATDSGSMRVDKDSGATRADERPSGSPCCNAVAD